MEESFLKYLESKMLLLNFQKKINIELREECNFLFASHITFSTTVIRNNFMAKIFIKNQNKQTA